MTNQKIEIDLDKLEGEINGYNKIIENATKVIEDAKNERSLKIQLRDYILENYSTSSKKQTPLFPELAKTPAVGEVGQPTGISDFIRDFIKNHDNCHTNDIVFAYSKFKGIEKDAEISKVVSRSLTRLKNAGDIANKLRDGGKRAGSNWSYIVKYKNTMG